MAAKRYPKGVERREQILDAAYEVLSRDGYSKTSLGQIGRSLGIQPANIIYYFGSRENLLIEVLRRWDVGTYLQVEPQNGNDREVLGFWLDIVALNSQHPGIVQLYTAFAAEASDPEHAAHDYFQSRFADTQRLITAELEKAQAEGRARVDDPAAAAAMLISLSDGLQIRWLIDRGFDMVRALRRAIAAVTADRAGNTAHRR